MRNAVRFVKEAGAEAVKVEGGERRMELIARLVEAEIPVMGHIGLTPQSVHALGGFRVQGKTVDAAEQLLRDARAVEAAGAFSVVLESIPRELAAQITRELRIPTIGIGAGPGLRRPDPGAARYDRTDRWTHAEIRPAICQRGEVDLARRCARTAEDVRGGTFPGGRRVLSSLREGPKNEHVCAVRCEGRRCKGISTISSR